MAMVKNEQRSYRVRVLRPCMLMGERAETGAEVALPLEHARSAVCSGRCEEVDPLPRQTNAIGQ